MPLLQGQPFRLIKPPENVEPGTDLYTIQHTGEKFISKSDYEDRLALYSQSIWTCQCTGKSGMNHQEAWTSESKVRVLLSSSFPAALWTPILKCIHHSTQPLDQLVETTSAMCNSRFYPGEELMYKHSNELKQVRVVSSREAPEVVENGSSSPDNSIAGENTPLTNGCDFTKRDGVSINGSSNGSSASDEGGSPSNKGKEDSPVKKKGMLPLFYDVVIVGEDIKIKDVPASDLLRTYKTPPKEHFRLFIRANALRQRASAFTPWIVSEELVTKYKIPSKLASVFTQPSFNFGNKKRKMEQASEKVKKSKQEVSDSSKKIKTDPGKVKKEPKTDPGKVKKEPKTDPGKVKKEPKTDPGKTKIESKPDLSKMTNGPNDGHVIKQENIASTPKIVEQGKTAKLGTPVKRETSDSDDEISLAALVKKSPPSEKQKLQSIESDVQALKMESNKDAYSNKKMKQATLFDMKSGNKTSGETPSKSKTSPQKKVVPVTPESVMRMPVMRRLIHELKICKGVRGKGRRIVHILDQALNRLTMKQIAVIPNPELKEELLNRREKVLEKKVLATMSAEDREVYLKQKAKEERRKKAQMQRDQEERQNKKLEDRIILHLKPLPAPKLVHTPEDIPNSLFGDITMIVEFIENYREVVLTDKKKSISCQHLMQALAAGKEGFKFISEIMVLLLHIIIDDERIGDNKELGVKISELAVHYQTALELARLCLSRGSTSDSASQHSNDYDIQEECELSEGLLTKLDNHELYELQTVEIIELLRALCHLAMSSYTCLEYVEDIEEKAAGLHKQYIQIKKEQMKEELLKKKEKREEIKMKKKSKSPRKPGRPKKVNTLESFVTKEENPDIVSVVKKRKRLTAEQLRKEKAEQKKEMREKRRIEEEEMRKANIIAQFEKLNRQKETILRLRPLGVDRNHDRYWLFNCTTPGLYVEKGWVDANTTYCVKSPSPRKEHSEKEFDKEKSPKSVIKAISFTTPTKSIQVQKTTSSLNVCTNAVSVVSSTVSTTQSLSKSLTVVSSTTVSTTSSVTVVNSSSTGHSESVNHNSSCNKDILAVPLQNSGLDSPARSVISNKTKEDSVTSAVMSSSNNTVSMPLSSTLPHSNSEISPIESSSAKTPLEKSLSPNVNSVSVSNTSLTSPAGLAKSTAGSVQVTPSKEIEGDKQEGSQKKVPLTDSDSEDKPLSMIKKELDASPFKAKARRGRPPKPREPGDKTPARRGRPPSKEKTPGDKTPRPRGRPPMSPSLNSDGTPAKSPGTPRSRGRPKVSRALNADETFPPVGQNMWFYFSKLEEIDSLVEALTTQGIRESKLKTALNKARKHLETNLVKEWEPLDDFVDGSVQLLETLREDIIQIEKELAEGWLGSVPDAEAWDKKASEASSVQELGECLIEAQRHMQIKFLKGMMKPVRKPIPMENPEAPQEYEEIECGAVQQWRDAVSSCSTLSRLHLLVGMFDSCIKWEKSMAMKKCKVCRAQDLSIPLATCGKCEGSYHWRCLRPQLREEPLESWLCPACQPSKTKERRKITRNQMEEEEEETPCTEVKQEKICRVCERGIGLIFCSSCPAAYHSECHNPPLQTRARKDWECVDCQKSKSRSKRSSAAAKKEAAPKKKSSKKGGKSSSRSSSRKRTMYTEIEEDEDEETSEDEEEESTDEDYSTKRKSKRARKTVNPPRRTTGRSVRKKSYKIESEEEEEEEMEEEQEQEKEEGSEEEEDDEDQQGEEEEDNEEDNVDGDEGKEEDENQEEEEEENQDDEEEENQEDEEDENQDAEEEEEDEDNEQEGEVDDEEGEENEDVDEDDNEESEVEN